MRATPIKDRLMAKVKVYADGCWFWTGVKTGGGYGKLSVQGRSEMAHRVSYELFKGPIPDGLTLDHLCGHPGCVNPDHLEAVTLAVNLFRSSGFSAVNAKKTHCPKGHEFSGENLYLNKHGRRVCRACSRSRWATSKARATRQAAAAERQAMRMPITHCHRGHPYDDANLRWQKTGRLCLACKRLTRRERERKARDKAA